MKRFSIICFQYHLTRIHSYVTFQFLHMQNFISIIPLLKSILSFSHGNIKQISYLTHMYCFYRISSANLHLCLLCFYIISFLLKIYFSVILYNSVEDIGRQSLGKKELLLRKYKYGHQRPFHFLNPRFLTFFSLFLSFSNFL